jgi:hypothetical protein
MSSGDYYISITHRNHIAIATNTAVSFLGSAVTVDLTNNISMIRGGALAVSEIDTGIYGMIAGDSNGNGSVQTTDINPILQAVGQLGYSIKDINLNGAVQTTDTPIAKNLVGKVKQF